MFFEIFSASLLLLNKLFLVWYSKVLGWICGIIGIISLSLFLYLQMVLEHKTNLWIMIVSNLSSSILMFYGLLIVLASNKSLLKVKLEEWNLVLKFIVITLTIIVCVFLLIKVITADLVVIQFILSTTSLLGTLSLAFNRKTTNIIGWVLYAITNILSAYVMFKINSPIVFWGQILSIPFAGYGIILESKKK